MYHGILLKKDSKLTHPNTRDELKFKYFKESLAEGDRVEVYMEVITSDGSLAQLAKVHKLIRILAQHTGHSFSDMKLLVKDEAGLCVTRSLKGKEFFVCKSFGDCSREELGKAIEACISIGESVNLILE